MRQGRKAAIRELIGGMEWVAPTSLHYEIGNAITRGMKGVKGRTKISKESGLQILDRYLAERIGSIRDHEKRSPGRRQVRPTRKLSVLRLELESAPKNRTPENVGKGVRRDRMFQVLDAMPLSLPKNTATADELVGMLREQAGYSNDPKPKRARSHAA